MHVQMNRPVTLAGKTYGKGTHDLPEDGRKDWYFEKLVANGDIQILRDVPTVAVGVELASTEETEESVSKKSRK